jgi:hypothetical protein
MFFKGSRYERVLDDHYTDPVTRRRVAYKRIRYIASSRARMGHIVSAGDRLDLIATRYYRDPEQFWRICDANLALWPPQLMADKGSVVRIPEVGMP